MAYGQTPEYQDYLTALESERALPPGIGNALMLAESGGDPSAQSPTGPKGLFQMSRAAVKETGGGDPFDPVDAGRMGLDYFTQMLNQFGDLPTAIAAYHDGPSAVAKGRPWSKAARSHVDKVLAGMPSDDDTAAILGAAGVAQEAPEEGDADILSILAAADEGSPLLFEPSLPDEPKEKQAAALPPRRHGVAGLDLPAVLAEEYGQALTQSKELMQEPFVGYKALGVLGYLTAPLTAVSRTLVGEPAERTAENIGVPEKYLPYVGLAAELAMPGLGVTSLPGTAAKIEKAAAAARGTASVRAIHARAEFDKHWTASKIDAEGQPVSTEGIEVGEVEDVPFQEVSPKPESLPPSVSTKGIEVEERAFDEDVVLGEGLDRGVPAPSPEIIPTTPYNPEAKPTDFTSTTAYLHDAFVRPGSTVNNVLDRIANLKFDLVNFGALAKGLRKLDLTTSIRMAPNAEMRIADRYGIEQTAVGEYFIDQNKIKINEDYLKVDDPNNVYQMTRTVLHETLHGATSQIIQRVQEGLSVPAYAQAAVKKFDDIYRFARSIARTKEELGKKATLSDKYGFTDTYEFMAEAYTNSEFQDILRGLPALNPTGKIKSLWRQILNTVRMGAALPNTPGIMNALDEAMSAGRQVIKAQQKFRKAEDTSGIVLEKALGDPRHASVSTPGGGPPGRTLTPKESLADYTEKWIKRVAPLTGGRSIRQLYTQAKRSPTLRSLLNQIEHRQAFELRPGETAAPDYTERVLSTTGKYLTALDKIFDTRRTTGLQVFTPGARKALTTELRTGATTVAARQVRAILDHANAYFNAAGLKVGYVEGFFPRIYVPALANGTRLDSAFTQVLMNRGRTQLDAENILQKIKEGDGSLLGPDNEMASEIYIQSKGNSPGRWSHAKYRSLGDIPDEELAPFLHSDPRTTLKQYITQGVRRAEHARIFGANGEKLKAMMPQIQAEMTAAGRPLHTYDVDYLTGLSQALLGRYNPITEQWLAGANKLVSSYELIRTLALSARATFVAPFALLEHGPQATASAVYNGITYAAQQSARGFLKAIPKHEARAMLEELNLVNDHSLVDTLQEAASGRIIGLDDDTIRALGPGKALTLFFKLNLEEGMSNWGRAMALGAGKTSIKNTISGYGRNQKGIMAQRLRALGVDPDDALAWLRTTDGDYSVTHPYQGAIKTALTRWINESVPLPRPATKPLWFSDPHWALIAQLRSQQASFGNTVLRRWGHNVKDAYKSPQQALTAAYSIGAAAAMTYAASLSYGLVDQYLFGNKGNPATKKLTPTELVARHMDQAGLSGGLQPATNIIWGEEYKQEGALFGPAGGQALGIITAAPSMTPYAIAASVPGYQALPATKKKEFIKWITKVRKDMGFKTGGRK